MKTVRISILASAMIAIVARGDAEISRIWLTHQTTTPEKIVVNWETDVAGDSIVEFGVTASPVNRIAIAETTTLHHVEIPLAKNAATNFYRVKSGTQSSAVCSFKSYLRDELRVAVVGDTGYSKSPWGDAVLREDPHLLVSAGDNVPALHTGQKVAADDIAAFLKLVERWPAVFRSIPWMPALGNHDREMRPRGPKPPPEPVYDIEATAFRKFVALPGVEWHWNFDVPDFGVRFIALDMSHLSDQGTTWQTCHAFANGSEQFTWFRDLISASEQPFVISIYNEQNSHVRGLEKGEWDRMISRGSIAITGFGYFAERADVDGFAFYNTSVSGTGARYADPKSVVLKSEDNFILLTFRRDPMEMTVAMKNLGGDILDQKKFGPRH